MGTLYCQTTGSATNSGSTDSNTASLTGSAATVAGSVVSLDGSPSLAGLATSGPTQASIYITQATNSNRKIFWITAVDDVLKTVTVDVAPTGVTSSFWAIGGRFVLTNASQEGALRAGDTLIFNDSPASQSGVSWTFRNGGDNTSGYAKIMGKSGVRPVLTTSGSGNNTVTTATQFLCYVENLELKQSHGSSGVALRFDGNGCVAYNVKVSQSPGLGINCIAGGERIIACEITGCGGDGINFQSTGIAFGNYIHANTGDGIEFTLGISFVLSQNIIASNGGRGIYLSSTAAVGNSLIMLIEGNTVYANGNSGLELVDADNQITLVNNIFVNNGDAAGEYNAEWQAGSAEMGSFHGWNDFYSAGGGGSGNLSGLTVNAQVANSEITTDPSLANPGSNDFSITSSSGAFATGFPGAMLGANTGRANMGPLQNNSASGGGGPFGGSAFS